MSEPNHLTLGELAERIGAELRGPAQTRVAGVASLEDAGPGDLSFVADSHHSARLAGSRAGAVVVPPGIQDARPCLVSEHPVLAFARAVALFAPAEPLPEPGIHPTAVVEAGAQVDPGAAVGPLCVIQAGAQIGAGTVLAARVFVGAGTRVGKDCRLYPGVVLRERLQVGDRVIIHPNAVIGADGFGFTQDRGHYIKIPQIGTVIIGDDVEIGANTTIDRAALGATRVGQGVKIDNLVMIAHNVEIGPDTVMAAQAGISGSTRVGSRVMIGGQVGMAGHLAIGDGAVLGAQAGVTRDVPPRCFVSGYPARPHQEAMRQLAETSRLPELRKRVRELEKKLGGPGSA